MKVVYHPKDIIELAKLDCEAKGMTVTKAEISKFDGQIMIIIKAFKKQII